MCGKLGQYFSASRVDRVDIHECPFNSQVKKKRKEGRDE